MTMIDKLPGDWLEEDPKHPARPDLPFLRHFTFAEGHAMEMGIGVAVLVYLAFTVDMGATAVAFSFGVARYMFGLQKKKSPDNPRYHTLGIHDIRSDPWYFVVAALATGAFLLGVFGGP